jgi:hypothetical protein
MSHHARSNLPPRPRLAAALTATAAWLAGCGDGLEIHAILPDSGAARGGEVVVIEGAGFADDVRVWFGEVEATAVTAIDPGTLEVVTPPHLAGRVEVVVGAAGGEARADGFTYQPLELRFVAAAPHYLPDLGGLVVSAAAAGDLDGDGDADLLVASRDGTSRALPGNGAGGFTDPLAAVDPTAPVEPLLAWTSDTREVLAEDFDGDGDLDVLACTAGGAASRLFEGRDGGFAEISGQALPPRRAACVAATAADLTGDGLLDVALIGVDRGSSARHLEILVNRGGEGLAFDLAAGLAAPRPMAGQPIGGVWASVAGIAATYTFADHPVAAGAGAGALHYDLSAAPEGGRVVFFLDAPSTPSAPAAMELDLHGDASSHQLYLEIEDGAGEFFSTTAGAIDWTGWRRVRVDGIGTWQATGGDADGLIDAPIRRATVGLVAAAGAPPLAGDLYLDNLVLEDADGQRTVVDDFERDDRRHQWPETISSLAAADLDADGDADLVLSSAQADAASHLRLLVQQTAAAGDEAAAALTFHEIDAYALPALPDPVSRVVLFDADRDGDRDALAVVAAGQDRLLVNDGAGYFFDATTSALPVDRVDGRAVAVADLDLDGDPDLAIANHGDTNRLYLGRGDGSFADHTPALPLDELPSALVLALDADRDGDRDLLYVNDSGRALELYVSVPAMAARSANPPPPGAVIAHLPWGGSGHAVGRVDGDQAASEGPMSFAAAADGGLYLLDQVGLRVLALRADGTIAREIPIPAATFQELAVWPDGRLILLDRLARASLVILDPRGRLLDEHPVVGEGIPEGGGVTAMFARDDGVWLEFGHLQVVKVLGRDLAPCAREIVPGRIVVPGRTSVGAAIDYRGGARLWLADLEKNAVAAETEIRLPDPIARLIWVEADANGHTHVLCHVLDFAADDFRRVTVDKVVGLEYDAGLRLVRSFESPHVIVEHEQFREFLVTPQGGVLQMSFADDGVSLRRWR